MQSISVRVICSSALVSCLFLLLASNVVAQVPGKAATSNPGNQNQEAEITPAEDVSFPTKDGVLVVATYFAGPKSKDTPPVILLHDWKGERKKLASFAQYLQKQLQCSVLVPDLRGHGSSLKLQGSDKELNLNRFKKADVVSAVYDIERCKKFLMARNNLGELNIELLSIISVGKTSVHAVQWAIDDWSWGMTPGGLKQGQDVKMIAMVSPSQVVGGISMKQNLKMPLMSGKGMQPLPLQIVWANKNTNSTSEAKAIYDAIKKPREKSTDSALVMTRIDDSNQSPTGMVTDQSEREAVFEKVAEQIREKILSNRELLGWQNRSRK